MSHTLDKEQKFQEISYKKHEEWYNQLFPTEESKADFLEKNSPKKQNAGNWLQQIFFSCLDPLLKHKDQTWLTVGDAYGFDAHYIIGHPYQEATASDLNEDFLKTSKSIGLITNFTSQNAEKLSFDDDSFDFVLCKETYHHFPRPYAALYEMIRVAKKGIVIIEPQDPISKIPLLLALVNIIAKLNPKMIKKIWKNQFSFEPVGNFVYKVSEREFEKMSAGLGLRTVAFKQINPNFHQKGLEKIEPSLRQPKFRNIWLKKGVLDFMTKWGFLPGQVLSTVIFKQKPNTIELEQLKKSGYKIVEIPENPYK